MKKEEEEKAKKREIEMKKREERVKLAMDRMADTVVKDRNLADKEYERRLE